MAIFSSLQKGFLISCGVLVFWNIARGIFFLYRSQPPQTYQENYNVISTIEQLNKDQFIWNSDKFASETNETVVIAIQVHKRKEYLQQLILSLSLAKGIENTLLIFSHDHWDPNINSLVTSIKFAKCMQIFFPFSNQLYPNEFPSDSENDCPWNATKNESNQLNCINKDWPDQYGHYREAKYSQLKHHFWWKANRIFDQLTITKNYKGLVLFLEEDYYVTEDFLHVLHMVNTERLLHHNDTDMIAFSKLHDFPNFDHLEFNIWPASVITGSKELKVIKTQYWYPMIGLAFSRVLWRKFHKCSSEYCTFDDYHYDCTLFRVAMTCLEEKVMVMLVEMKRVIHMGICGIHQKRQFCNVPQQVRQVQNAIVKVAKHLYPEKLILEIDAEKRVASKGWGGWADVRDHLLCESLSMPPQSDLTAKDILLSVQNMFENISRHR